MLSPPREFECLFRAFGLKIENQKQASRGGAESVEKKKSCQKRANLGDRQTMPASCQSKYIAGGIVLV
jgi:hypothetical protein